MILIHLSLFIKHKNLSFNKFEKSLDVSHGSISNAFKHKKNIGSNVIEKILRIYPEIRAEWLLRGEGEMLISKDSQKDSKIKNEDQELSSELIEQTIEYFNFKNKFELQAFFNQTQAADSFNTLEKTILSTWEKKYGQELKTIKYQLMTIFTEKLDKQQSLKSNSLKSRSS